jgi:hypothetical protein
MEDHYKRISNNINIILALIILSNAWCFYILSRNYEANIAIIMGKSSAYETNIIKIMTKAMEFEKDVDININKYNNLSIKTTKEIEDLRDYIITQFPKVAERDAEIIASEISKQCAKHKISFSLVAGLTAVESSYNKFAKSNKDCHGLMQIRYKVWGSKLGIKNRKDLYRIKVNINFGVGILKYYIEQNEGNITKALQEYNSTCNKEFPNKVDQEVKKFNSFRSAYEHSGINIKNICTTKIKPNAEKVKNDGPAQHKKQLSSKLGKRKRLLTTSSIQYKHKIIHKQ